MAFDHAVATLREGGLLLHDEKTFLQLAAVDGNTLKVPPGQHDDRAMACVLVLAAIKWCSVVCCGASAIIPPRDLLEDIDRAPWS